MLKVIKVKLKNKEDRSYNVIIGENILNKLGKTLKSLKLGDSIFIITDNIVGKLYGRKVIKSIKNFGFKDIGKIEIKTGEESKSFNTYIKILNKIYDFDKNQQKKVVIVTLGGGVIGDLGGFVAGTYKRGVNYIQVPTTLLGQVDCGIGGKTAFNFREAKNLIGAFWQPKLVYMDINVLKTLGLREIRCGLAEVIKYGVIKDFELFKYLEKNIEKILNYDIACLKHIILTCVKIKAKITSLDERDEKGIRIILNFGHTIGHAIESATNYKVYKHGEAIALGMIAAGGIAKKLRLFSDSELKRLKNLIKRTGLPVKIKDCSLKDIMISMKRDKKFISGVNRFILPAKIGQVKVKEKIGTDTILSSLISLFP
ncbi:MAG: 3-dehydroquinate synthase [Candidatus Firestonebacteria bacterium]